MNRTLRVSRQPGAAAAGFVLLLGVAACVLPPPAPEPLPDETDTSEAAEPELTAILLRGTIGPKSAWLEPVMVTAAPPDEPATDDGPFRLWGLDEQGEALFDLRFGDAALVAAGDTAERHFQFVVPMDPEAPVMLARVELSAGEGRAFVRHSQVSVQALQSALAGEAGLTIERGRDHLLRLRWDATRFPLLQLRDPESGAILALGRYGELAIEFSGDEVELALTDGVKTAAKRLSLR